VRGTLLLPADGTSPKPTSFDALNSPDVIDQTIARAGQQARRALKRFPRSVSAVLVMMLAGFGVTAFGVAPLVIDAGSKPQVLLTEAITVEDLGAQIQALTEHDLSLSRNDFTRRSDTAESLLRRMGVDDPAAVAFIRTNSVARELLSGSGGKMVQAKASASGVMEELVARYPARRAEQAETHFTRLTVSRDGGGRFAARTETVALGVQSELRSGLIRGSLFSATDDAGVPDSVASQLAEVFAAEIDFHKDLRRGDSFTVEFEALTADGEPVSWDRSARRLLAAEFVNRGRAHSAVWFQSSEKSRRGGYFDFNGKAKQRAFLASPMEFSRVTSGFAMRFHPILQNWRKHAGVDYGAPSGTSVRTVADGVVDFAGWKNGYGNVVSVKHDKDRSTVYAHLSRIDVRKGQAIHQGSRIGAVGSTGWATGPHLHFEFKVGGAQRDPASIAALADTVALAPASRRDFSQLTQSVRVQLEAAETTRTATLFE
jgi:murein DD-endopeptidase MepM/ murein hydrolase activator NlpD